MQRFTHNSDGIRPTNVVATLDDYERERENERQRVQRLLAYDTEEDSVTNSEDTDADQTVIPVTSPTALSPTSCQSTPDLLNTLESVTHRQDRDNTQTVLQVPQPSILNHIAGQSTPNLATELALHGQPAYHYCKEESDSNFQMNNLNSVSLSNVPSSGVHLPSPCSSILPPVPQNLGSQYSRSVDIASQQGLPGNYAPFYPQLGNVVADNAEVQVQDYMRHQWLTSMGLRSFEEVRYEDYIAGRKPAYDFHIFNRASQQGLHGSYVPFSPPLGNDVIIKHGVQVPINTRHQCITAMELYSGKSLEELRFEDYIAVRKRQQVVCGEQTFFGNTVPVWPSANAGAREGWCIAAPDGRQIFCKSVNVDREVLQLLNNKQISMLVKDDIYVEVNCIKTTGQINIMALSKEHVQKAIECINMKISHYKRERPAEKACANICANDVVGNCRSPSCSMLHNPRKLPYDWQVRLFGSTWKTLDGQEDIEMAFCNNKESVLTSPIPLNYNDISVSVHGVKFDPDLQAAVQVSGGDGEIVCLECRRLTTKSYKETAAKTPGFETQWRWYWKDNKSWKLYEPKALQHTLEEKFLAGQRDYHFFKGEILNLYRVTFSDMDQVNLLTQKTRTIHRRPVFVSSPDVRASKHPSSLQQVPEVPMTLPPSWVSLDHAHPFELVRFLGNSQTFKEISNSFFETLDRTEVEIDSIYRLQNSSLWSTFSNQEKIMEDKAKREGLAGVDKRHLFHGTDSLDAVYGICVNNFDFRLSGKNATAFGHGAYFAKTASYSHRYTGAPKKGNKSHFTKPNSGFGFGFGQSTGHEVLLSDKPMRYMFVASVLVGRYTKGSSSYRRPPNKPGSAHELFDSCVNDESNPEIFVIFDKTQCYPAYLIQYH